MGHICSGGTMANLEALWVAGKINPDKLIVASELAHYTHSRISEVLKTQFPVYSLQQSGSNGPGCTGESPENRQGGHGGGDYRFYRHRFNRSPARKF